MWEIRWPAGPESDLALTPTSQLAFYYTGWRLPLLFERRCLAPRWVRGQASCRCSDDRCRSCCKAQANDWLTPQPQLTPASPCIARPISHQHDWVSCGFLVHILSFLSIVVCNSHHLHSCRNAAIQHRSRRASGKRCGRVDTEAASPALDSAQSIPEHVAAECA